MAYRLVQDKTGTPIDVGQKVTTFRGEVVTVASLEPPRHPGSSGKVYCKIKSGLTMPYYPAVIGAHYEEIDK